MTPRWPRPDDALLGLALLLFVVAGWASLITLATWAADLDRQTRLRTFATPGVRAPLGVCRDGRIEEWCR